MVLATWLLHQHQEKLRNPNNEVITSTDGSKRSITLQRDRHAQYLVTGFVNNARTEFLVDTGASSVSIPEEVAKRAGLVRKQKITTSTANGFGTAYITDIDVIRIGELEVRNPEGHINPGLSDYVLLGMSVLQNYQLEQVGDELIIREP